VRVRTYRTFTAPEVKGEASQKFHTIVLNTNTLASYAKLREG
jgi:hypothetical protein